MTDTALLKTPLHAEHTAAGARLVGFGGWDMPVQYSGIGDEHCAVRQKAGRFDVSHMGRFHISGPGAIQWLESVLPTRIAALRTGQMAYSILCTPEGGAVDDLAVYRRGEDRFLLVVNASRANEDLQTLQAQLPSDGSVTMTDRTAQEAMVAVQGPEALSIVTGLEAIQLHFQQLEDLGFFRFRQTPDASWLISRSGYTGEDGFEIICPAEDAVELWRALDEAHVQAIGLGARDTLRTEMGYPLYGHELSLEIGPVEAGLEWALALDKQIDFTGREALLARRQGSRRLVGLRIEGKGIPRAGCEVTQQDCALGVVTSGTYSPSLQAGIALALIDTRILDRQQHAAILVRGRPLPAVIRDLPFVPSRVKRRSPRRSRTS
ncbi:MAG: glycine cleavage system aminomethyltransferase GcvT [Gemmatimonadetes bacterium]|nr:glycine cleavage system aminomethyltransferase GcvT [Gemmatimonadota bacterium]MBT6145079.1 glycine cleavage system aminomethyltransferase GcvT [Gemmatimonadota bacterium]MBT7863396.1 glycine cleavage system aminomethyltransferase GcvT [Gemmatimonadota bacterium]